MKAVVQLLVLGVPFEEKLHLIIARELYLLQRRCVDSVVVVHNPYRLLISLISIQLEGRICLRDQPTIKAVTFVSKEETLWEINSENETCPGIIPLSMPFPTSYRERVQGRTFRLPPSFELSSQQRVVIVYTLQIIVTKSRNVPVIGKKLSG
jgi:hypothetical protein